MFWPIIINCLIGVSTVSVFTFAIPRGCRDEGLDRLNVRSLRLVPVALLETYPLAQDGQPSVNVSSRSNAGPLVISPGARLAGSEAMLLLHWPDSFVCFF